MGVTVKVVNKDEIIKKLGDIKGPKAKQAFDRTRADLVRRVPGWAAQVATRTYAVPRNLLNPTTKAGSGKGSVSASGGDLLGLEFEYRGRRLSIGGTFKMKPAAHRPKPYKITANILRGKASPFGHWSTPWSEGGKYGPQSPFMLVPGVQPPIQRTGSTFSEAARGLAVPQMVVSERTKDELRDKLETEALKRLEHHVSAVLGS